MLALQCVKSIPAWLLLKTLGSRFPSLCTGPYALLRLREVEPPRLPGPHWVRIRPLLSGICGSDLASITAEGSPFFAPLTSFPFTFGHEVVGTITEMGPQVQGFTVGDTVVLEPALHCAIRGIDQLCAACAMGQTGNCVNVAKGDLAPGVQTGYCRDTGGGWSTSLVAHHFQLHKVPAGMSLERAVLTEPYACALHAVLRAYPGGKLIAGTGERVLVLGCGSMGLLTIAALRNLGVPCRIFALAKHRHQQELARELGAAEILVAGRDQDRELCRHTGATLHQPEIGRPTVLGGFDVVFDCVGSPRSVDDALRFTVSRGRTVLVGMPSIPKTVDWTTIWYKELQVLGTYTYGLEDYAGGQRRTFALALDHGDTLPSRLVTHTFPLRDYKTAIRTALQTGHFQAVKTVFTLGSRE